MGFRIRALMVSAATTLTFCSVGALALGLGEIKLNSALNQPLDAEIQLLQVRDLSEEEIKVSLATREEFDRLGVERPFFLTDLKFNIDLDAQGGPVVRISSLKPVREPFLDFVIQARWPSGKLLREYTLLVDLPVFSGSRQPAVSAPAQPSRAVSPQPTPQPQRQPPRVAPAPEPTPAPEQAQPGVEEYGPVSASDTLWGIAARVRPGNDVTVQQTMLAIQRVNPDAFINNNINLLRRGQVLRVPSQEEVQRLSAREAVQEVANQNRAWSDGVTPSTATAPQLEGSKLAGEARTESAEPQGRVKLSAPASGEAGSAQGSPEGEGSAALESQLTATQEQLDAATRENDELRSRIAAMEEQIETMERLVEVSSAEMRALELAAQKTNNESQAAPASPEAPQNQAAAPEDSAQPTRQQPETPTASSTETPETTTAKVTPPAQKSWLDLIMENLLYIGAGLGALVVAVLAWLFMRNRGDSFDDEFGDFNEDYDFQETGSESKDDNGLVAAAAARHNEAPLEDYHADADDHPEFAEAETEDVVAESDIHIKYGQFNLAEEKLQRALTKDPSDTAVRLKLLEVYAAQNETEAFDQQYADLLALNDEQANLRAEALRETLDGAGSFQPSRYNTSAVNAMVGGAAAYEAVNAGRTSNLAETLDLSDKTLGTAAVGDTLVNMNARAFDNVAYVEEEANSDGSDEFELDLDLGDQEIDDNTVVAAPVRGAAGDDGLEDLALELEDTDFDASFGDVDFELGDEFENSTSFASAMKVELVDNDEVDAEQGFGELAQESDDTVVMTKPTAQTAGLDFDFSNLDLEDDATESHLLDESDEVVVGMEDDGTDFDSEAVTFDLGDELIIEPSESLAAVEGDDFADISIGMEEAMAVGESQAVAHPDQQDFAVDLEIEDFTGDGLALDSDESDQNTPDGGLVADELDAPILTERASEPEFEGFESESGLSLGNDVDLTELDHELDELAMDFSSADPDAAPKSTTEPTLVEEVADSPAAFAGQVQGKWDEIEEADFIEVAERKVPTSEVTEKAQVAAVTGVHYVAPNDADYEIPDFDPEADDDSNLDFLSDTDETATKLDLARAYIDMGDADGARDILGEVMDEGSQDQKQQAQTLLARLG